MERYDVIIVGASFAGLALAHHLPRSLKILVVEVKPEAGSTVESTGLITSKTRAEFASFLDIDRYITNPITAICVIAPNYDDWFVSATHEPWIYQTDTKALVKCMADTVPPNVTVRTGTAFVGVDNPNAVSRVTLFSGGVKCEVETRFLVGADGAQSKVAHALPRLDPNKQFLFGYEQVFFGTVHLGPKPAETIYHFWFGEFSLGYGGWLSPTVVEGRPAFRLGLAKLMKDRGDAQTLTAAFVRKLVDRGIIKIEGDIATPGYVFGSVIPIGGVLKRIHEGNILLLGNAAGYCGAFAADGIKGSIISGKEAAPLIAQYLNGLTGALAELSQKMNTHDWLLDYYRRQVRYRQLWDCMKRNRTFTALYRVIEKEKETFLEQFCDSKDKRRSLTRTVLKWKHLRELIRYAWYLLRDILTVR